MSCVTNSCCVTVIKSADGTADKWITTRRGLWNYSNYIYIYIYVHIFVHVVRNRID